MAGKLVGEILDALEVGLALSDPQRLALITIAEKCHADTRLGSVRTGRIRAVIGRSTRTTERTLAQLEKLGLIRVVKRGYRSRDGKLHAPVYELLAPATQTAGPDGSAAATWMAGADGSAAAKSDLATAKTDLAAAIDPPVTSDDETHDVTYDGTSYDVPPSLARRGVRAGAHAREASSRPPTREEQGLHPLPENQWIEPPKHCPLHPDDTTEPCIPCKIQREENEAWWDTIDDREQQYWRDHPEEARKRVEEREQARKTREAELDALFGNAREHDYDDPEIINGEIVDDALDPETIAVLHATEAAKPETVGDIFDRLFSKGKGAS